jgi:putative transposase
MGRISDNFRSHVQRTIHSAMGIRVATSDCRGCSHRTGGTSFPEMGAPLISRPRFQIGGADKNLDYNLNEVVRVLDRLVEQRGYPKQLRNDNGPEFISVKLAEWTETHGIHLEFIKRGKPVQYSQVERLNRTYRKEILDAYICQSLDEVRELTRTWVDQYNGERPHTALGRVTPLDYRRANSRDGTKVSPAQKAG